MDLKPLLYPKSIAVIGVSRTVGKVGHEIFSNLINSGFEGELFPINPKADEILGVKCFPDMKSVGKPLDLSVIAVPTPAVENAVDMSLDAGVGAMVIITAGFREVGEKGLEVEERIAKKCAARSVRLLGPNCLGLLNTANKMNASFAGAMPPRGSISVISQSGALCTAMLDLASGRRLGLAKLVSIGNKADLKETDFLKAFAEDEETKVIVGYIESISSGGEFVRVTESVTSQKPVVMLKGGVTKAGAKAASSHTGSLAGAETAYGAAFKRSGVIRAESFEALFDYATAFAMQPLPKGDRLAIITNAGGPGIMAADAAEQAGLKVVSLEKNIATALKAKLPSSASVGNPIDVLGDADPERYATAIKAALEDNTVDAVIVILTPQAMTKPVETAGIVAECASGSEKPLLAVFMGGHDVIPGREELVKANLPDYTSPERAVAALRAMVEYYRWKKRPPRIVTRFSVNRRRAERIISRHLKTRRPEIGEVKAKEILKAYNFLVPEGEVAVNADEAVEIGERIGFPVVMKIVSPQIIHKSDLKGVKLDLYNPEAVRDAFDLMMLRTREAIPGVEIEGAYVEKMCQSGLEVIIGMNRDPRFGPMLMFGLGGIFVEVMKDVSFYLAPITADEAMQMLLGTKSYELLKGVRGRRGANMPAIAHGLQLISQLATDFPQIKELDINPFIVGEKGIEPMVADARMTLSLGEEGG